MLVPNRNFPNNTTNNGGYRYGFQGQELDDEIKNSKGTSINYKFRMHDPRVGRFFAVDPLFRKYPHNSVYAFSENRVIDGVELEGLEWTSADAITRTKMRGTDPAGQRVFDKAEERAGMVALTLMGAGAIYRLGQGAYLWYLANPIVASEIANETTAFAWNIMLDEPYPGPAIGDDAANGLKLLVKGLSDTKVAQKFVIPLGKLNFGLGKGTTVLKDLAKVSMKEIVNMAKSLTRGKKFKEQGIKTAEDIARLTAKAFDEGADVTNKAYKGLTKQVELYDGTKVNFSFEKVEDIYELKTITIPDVDEKELTSKIKELINKAKELGNENF